MSILCGCFGIKRSAGSLGESAENLNKPEHIRASSAPTEPTHSECVKLSSDTGQKVQPLPLDDGITKLLDRGCVEASSEARPLGTARVDNPSPPTQFNISFPIPEDQQQSQVRGQI